MWMRLRTVLGWGGGQSAARCSILFHDCPGETSPEPRGAEQWRGGEGRGGRRSRGWVGVGLECRQA